MTAMILHALSLDERALSQPLAARFDERGGSVGRADHNTLALPDPERLISRIQAEISCQDGRQFRITNVSRASQIVVAGRSLSFGESSALQHHDVIRIGGYVLETRLERPPAPPVEDEQRTVVRAPRSAPLTPSRVARLNDPFAELWPAASVERPPGRATAEPLAPAIRRGPAEHPLADPLAPATSASSTASLPDDPLTPPPSGSIDDLFGIDPSNPDPLGDFLAETRPPRRPFPPPPGVPRPEPLFEIEPVAAAAPTQAPISNDPLWAAFCEGAGVPIDAQLTPELMRTIGRLLRSAVTGAQQLVAIRATTKYELGAQVTMIQARDNNPLKFAPDGPAAVEQLLKPPMRGFLGGPEAMTDAMNDLVGHSIGTMAGMRAALEGVLDRFTPDELERKLGASRMLDNLVPMSRKARLWELYLQHFQLIRSEAQDDFHTLFGKAFLSAYEKQLDALHAAALSEPSATPTEAAQHNRTAD